MAYGLRTYDAAGNIMVDTSTRLTRVLGSTTVSSTGSVTVPEFATDGSPWYAVFVDQSTPYAEPEITFSGTTLSWNYGSASPRATVFIIYGTY